MIKRTSRIIAGIALLFTLAAQGGQKQPNVILIMVDDMGYSDLGCYGGEIDTPNLDRLADNGLRYSQFRVTPMCLTSRIALMSGMSYSDAGRSTFKHAVPLPRLLRDAGYSTSMSGKAHGFSPIAGNPKTDFGFDRHFGLNDGMSRNYAGSDKWVLNGKPFRDFEDFYSTTAITDTAIGFIRESLGEDKPFFSHIAYTAPHSPLQAPKEVVQKYLERGTYAKGWDALREQRFRRQKKLGLFPENATLPAKGVEVPDWKNLPKRSSRPWELDRDYEELCVAVYASMVDVIDQDIGRLMTFLEDPDGDGNSDDSIVENTLIFFMSDNGNPYAGPFSPKRREHRSKTDAFNTNYGWGMLSNTPFRYYKHSGHEGGIRSPLIAHWPAGIAQPEGTLLTESCNLWDIYPTLLELAGATYPSSFGNAETRPLVGTSLLPSFDPASGQKGGSRFFISSFARSRAVIDGHWKLVSYWDSPWELYNLSADPFENKNVADSHPEVFDRLVVRWQAHAKKNSIRETYVTQ